MESEAGRRRIKAAYRGHVFESEQVMKIRYRTSTIISIVLTTSMLVACATRTSYVDLYGDPAPVSAAQRTIVIGPDTKYVNVEGGQIVKFVAGDKEFAWNFFVARTVSMFRLNEVAPAGVLDHEVRAYVSPDPRYIGADGRAE
jgi:hypothetical protein